MSFAKHQRTGPDEKINCMNTLELMEPKKPTTRIKDSVLLPYGLMGFEQVKNYRLLTKPDETPFLRFQMLDDGEHSFLLVPPGTVVANYQPDLAKEDVEFLQLNDPSDALILNTVTVKRDGKATVNLKGPIVINRRTWIGKQVIPTNAAEYALRHPLPVA
jgi:flagellar assembly factor FliW